MIQLNYIILALCLVLPGVGLSRKILTTRPSLNPSEGLVLAVIISLLHISVYSLITASLGVFNVKLIWLLLLISSVIYLWIFRNEKSLLIDLCSDKKALALLTIITLISFFSFSKPAQWMTNYHMDAGRYSNIASFLLNNKGFDLKNRIEPYSSDLGKRELSRVPGYFRKKGHINYVGQHSPPYLHTYPALLAFVRAHIPIYESFKLNWALAVLSALSFYLLLYLSFGSRILASGGALLLFTNPACQLYFNRNMTETLSQVLLFSCFILIFLMNRFPSKLLAWLAASALALLAACRLEFGMLYALLPCTFAFLFIFSDEKPPKEFLFFLIALLLYLLPLDWYYNAHTFIYTSGNSAKSLAFLWKPLNFPYKEMRDWFIHIWVGVNALVLLFSIAAFIYKDQLRKSFSKLRLNNKTLKLCALAFIAFMLWNLLLRPVVGVAPNQTYSGGFHHDKINLLRLLHFQDITTLLLGLFGFYIIVTRQNFRAFAFFTAIMTCLIIYQSGHSPPVVWWIRRYIPVAIPCFYFLSIAAVWYFKAPRRYLLFVIPLLFNLYGTYKTPRSFVEKDGLYQYYKNLSAAFNENSVQICMDEDRCNHAAVPLHSHYNIPTLYLKPGLTDKKIEVLKHMLADNRDIIFTYSGHRESPFLEVDKELLAKAGLSYRLLVIRHYKTQDIWGLLGWSTGGHWSRLFIPATLIGPRFKETHFGVRLYRLTMQQEPTRST